VEQVLTQLVRNDWKIFRIDITFSMTRYNNELAPFRFPASDMRRPSQIDIWFPSPPQVMRHLAAWQWHPAWHRLHLPPSSINKSWILNAMGSKFLGIGVSSGYCFCISFGAPKISGIANVKSVSSPWHPPGFLWAHDALLAHEAPCANAPQGSLGQKANRALWTHGTMGPGGRAPCGGKTPNPNLTSGNPDI